MPSFYTCVQKSHSHDVWFQRYGVRWTEVFFILGHFLPFNPPNNPENQNFDKMKKAPGMPTFYTCVPKTKII